MTTKEESWIKTAKKQLISSIVILLVAAVAGLTGFYYTAKAEMANQGEQIKELKSVMKESSPEEVLRMKTDLTRMSDKIESLEVKVNSSVEIMKSFKEDQEKKADKMLDLLIELKSR